MTVLASGSLADRTSTETPGLAPHLVSSPAFLMMSIDYFVCVGHYSSASDCIVTTLLGGILSSCGASQIRRLRPREIKYPAHSYTIMGSQ